MDPTRPVTLPLSLAGGMFERARQAGHARTVAEWHTPADPERSARERIERDGSLAGVPERIVAQAARRLAAVELAELQEFEERAGELRELRPWRGRPNRFTTHECLLVYSLCVHVQQGLEPDADGVAKKRSASAARAATGKLLKLDPWATLPSYKRTWPDACKKAEREVAGQVRKAQEQYRALRRKLIRRGRITLQAERDLATAILCEAGRFWAHFRMLRLMAADGACFSQRAFDHPDEYPGFEDMCGIFVLAVQKLWAHARFLDDIDVLDRTSGCDALSSPAI